MTTRLISITFILSLLSGCYFGQPLIQLAEDIEVSDYFESREAQKMATAVLRQDLRQITYLKNIEYIDIDLQGLDHMSLLQWALLNDKPNSFKHLLELGTDTSLKLKGGVTISELATSQLQEWYIQQLSVN